MTSRILLFGVVAAMFASCSSVYQSKQTPDDVYYSPGRERDSYVTVNNRDRDYQKYSQEDYRNEYYEDDRWLRMRVRNPYRWSTFDNYAWNDWRYNTWSSGYYNPYAYHTWNNYWNNYYYWNSYYNPYCSRVVVVNPKTNPGVYDKVRNFSMSSYNNTAYNNANAPRAKGARGTYSTPIYNNTNTNNSYQRSARTRDGGRDSYYSPSRSGDRPVRTYSPSSESSRPSVSPSSSSSGSRSGGSSGGSSGGGAGSRPGRGGN